MSIPPLNLFLAALVLAAFQAVAAIPWAAAFDGRPFRRWITNSTVLGYIAGGTIVLAIALTFYMRSVADVAELELEPGHPGLGDEAYIERRKALFSLCREHPAVRAAGSPRTVASRSRRVSSIPSTPLRNSAPASGYRAG